MKVTLQEILSQLPGSPSEQWPDGERYAIALSHGSMSVGYYAPTEADPQKPHNRDEIYIIHVGSGEIVVADQCNNFAPGDVFFVASGTEHRFKNFSPDFATWVVFWGPLGGEHDN